MYPEWNAAANAVFNPGEYGMKALVLPKRARGWRKYGGERYEVDCHCETCRGGSSVPATANAVDIVARLLVAVRGRVKGLHAGGITVLGRVLPEEAPEVA